MKIIAKRQSFLDAATFAAQAIKPRTTLPSLACLRLDCTVDSVHFTGTDIESTASAKCEASADVDSLLLPANLLVDILSASKSDDVTIETGSSFHAITVGTHKSKLAVLSVEEFPLNKPANELAKFVISSAHLRAALDSVLWATGDIGRGPTFFAVSMDCYDDYVRFVATSGTAMAIVRHETGTKTGRHCAILPYPLAKMIHAGLNGVNVDVTVFLAERSITLAFEGRTISGLLVDGRMPPVDQVIPQSDSITIQPEINREALLGAIKRSTLFVDDRFFGVNMDFTDGNLRLSAKNGLHESAEDLPCTFTGQFSVRVNHNHIKSILDCIGTESVKIEASEVTRPIMIRSGNFMALTMPLLKG